MWNSSYKYLFWKVILSLFTGFTLYLPFSKYELWPLAFFVLVALLRFQDAIFWLLTGFFFFFLSLRCASIAAIEFGGVNPFLFYTLFTLFALFFSLSFCGTAVCTRATLTVLASLSLSSFSFMAKRPMTKNTIQRKNKALNLF